MTESINLVDRNRRSGIRDEWNAGRVREELVLRIQNGALTTQHDTEKHSESFLIWPIFDGNFNLKWVKVSISCQFMFFIVIRDDPS